jgi:hypothetical protein
MGWLADLLKELPLSVIQKAKLDEFQEKYDKLETDYDNLKEKYAWLDAELKRVKEQGTHGRLDDLAEKLLVAIANSDGRMPKQRTSTVLGLSQAQGNLFFAQLTKLGYIQQSTAMRDPEFRATPEGLEYLASHNLIK